MCTFVSMEDLVSNALIEILEIKNIREVAFASLNDYGIKVVELLEKNDEKAVLLLSKFYTDELIRNYSDFFCIRETSDGDTICLKEGITAEDLRKQFRAYLSVDLLLAFVNENSLSTLGVSRCQAS